MLKIAILSDIHANLSAFKAVLREVAAAGVDQIAVLGDIVGYGASPEQCVDLCGQLMATTVLGNHDLAALAIRAKGREMLDAGWEKSGYLAGLVHAADELDEDQADWLSKLPYARPIKGAFIAHASLDDLEEFGYVETYENAQPSLALLAAQDSKVGFFGHTHEQEVFRHPETELVWENETTFTVPEGQPCVVMAGSVGQPRHETDKRAAWVLWEPDARRVHLMKTDYNRLEAAKAIALAKLPVKSAMRILNAEELATLAGPAAHLVPHL